MSAKLKKSQVAQIMRQQMLLEKNKNQRAVAEFHKNIQILISE
jgi:hypothetical protein